MIGEARVEKLLVARAQDLAIGVGEQHQGHARIPDEVGDVLVDLVEVAAQHGAAHRPGKRVAEEKLQLARLGCELLLRLALHRRALGFELLRELAPLGFEPPLGRPAGQPAPGEDDHQEDKQHHAHPKRQLDLLQPREAGGPARRFGALLGRCAFHR
jgi:hypothetical protein